jgi:hypothetical protein
MPEVRLATEVDAVLDRLWREGQEILVERLEDAIDFISVGDRRARQHRLTSSDLPDGVWLITVHHGEQTWVIVWSEVSPGLAKVHGISATEAF